MTDSLATKFSPSDVLNQRRRRKWRLMRRTDDRQERARVAQALRDARCDPDTEVDPRDHRALHIKHRRHGR